MIDLLGGMVTIHKKSQSCPVRPRSSGHEELIGHALLMLDGDQLRWLYFGRNDALNDGLYLFVASTVIETAIKPGIKQLDMGLITYSIKRI